MEEEIKLGTLATRANEAHDGVISSLNKAIYYAKNAGDVLRMAKPKVGHGNWLEWLDQNFRASAETARVYMRISEHWESHILPAMEGDEGLTIEKAREIIQRPKKIIEQGVMPHAKPHAELSREHLLWNFKQWLNDIPEEGVICLHQCWEKVMVNFEDRLWDEMHKYTELGTPRRGQPENGTPCKTTQTIYIPEGTS